MADSFGAAPVGGAHQIGRLVRGNAARGKKKIQEGADVRPEEEADLAGSEQLGRERAKGDGKTASSNAIAPLIKSHGEAERNYPKSVSKGLHRFEFHVMGCDASRPAAIVTEQDHSGIRGSSI